MTSQLQVNLLAPENSYFVKVRVILPRDNTYRAGREKHENCKCGRNERIGGGEIAREKKEEHAEV